MDFNRESNILAFKKKKWLNIGRARESTDLVNSYNRSNAIEPVGLPPKNLNLQTKYMKKKKKKL